VEKPELEVGTECPIAMVDVVIEKLIGADPSPPTALPVLPNPIHTTNTVAMNGINIQPRVEVVHNVEQNVGHDDTVSKPAGTVRDLGPSVVASSTLHSPIGIPPDHVGVGLDIMDMLPSMPNSETLKELLAMSMFFVQLCRE
jgi:hypothetical protein